MKNSIFNAVCKTRYLALLVVLIFTCGNAWGYTGTFSKCTGTLTSGYYVFGVVESSTMHAVNNTVGTSWIKYTDVTISTNITNPANAVVWYYDATAGTIKNVDNTNYIYWTSGNVGCCGATSYAHDVIEASTGIYTVRSHATTSRILRRNGTSGYRYYSTSTGSQEIQFYKLSASCTSEVDVNKGSEIHGTYDLSGTTVCADGDGGEISISNIEPDDCYEFASITATVGTPDNTNKKVTGITAETTITVNFQKQTVNTYIDEIQGYEDMEECGTHDAPSLDDKTPASSGTCAQQHWHFMGWVTAANKANPTDANIIAPGTSMPANGTTYYAVWAKGTGGGNFDNTTGGTFYIYATVSGTNYYATSVSSNKLQQTTDITEATQFTFTKISNGVYSISDGSNYLYNTSSSGTNLATRATSFSWTISTGSHGSWRVIGDTRALAFRAGSYYYFGAYTTGNINGTEYFDVEIGGGYEYSDYITTCGSTYTITLAGSPAGTVTGGTFSASASSASAGTVITLTATPTRGYEFGSWTVTDASSNPVSVSNNQFTMPASNVTVSATFNTATPLTITLSTKSKGTFTNPDPWPIYSGETFTFPDVTPSDPSCATFVGWIAGTTFDGDGTTHDAPTGLITAGTESTAQTTDATYTAVFYETETTESDAYVKVTSAPANWANDHYLIVYEGDATHTAVAFDGKRDNGDNGNIDAASNGVEVTITNDAIAKTARLAAAEWRITAVTGGHSIQSASGFYIDQTTDANGLQTNSSTAYVNTLAYSSGFSVTGSGNAVLRYNYASDQLRFRYYKSSSYSSQQVIQLYKLGTAEVQTRTYTTNPSCTPKYRVTVASVTGGSPNADPRYNPESTEVSLTANPSAGYAFTGWTITKTTGGQNVTSTLLPGTKATTANTTFSMPAYDVTVTAAYSKKAVTELKVMDGSTVVANTTGSVSGTLNVSTGTNKTLDVVITPSDAFDHSWTASVTAGGTYASISNVTDGGFRVNGLSQGDATVTVTAPNDGTAKVVTFTVHVTDILPEEIILKRDGSETPIDALTMYYDAANSRGQYVKVNVSYSPTPTNKGFTFSSADATSVSSHAHAQTNPNFYETLNARKVTSSPVNCTFTSAATGSVTKVLAVTVLPCPADQFVDYIHGNATVTRAAQVSADHWSINTSITTPTLSDSPESSSADCEVGHYHLIGWLPQSIAEALFEAGTPITSATEGLVTAGAEIEASGTTWYAIWAKKE